MKKVNLKVVSAILAVILLLSVIPFSASAAETVVTTEQGLLDAIANSQSGDTITVKKSLHFSHSIEITKDLTLNVKQDETNPGMTVEISFFERMGAPDYEPFSSGFIISGATVTFNVEERDGIPSRISMSHFQAPGELFKLIGVEGKDTAVIINEGQFYPSNSVLFTAETPNGAVKPSITINDADLSSVTAFLSGDANAVICEGTFGFEPKEYLHSDSAYYLSTMGGMNGAYQVLRTQKEYSDAFKTIINDKGEIVINRYDVAEDETLDGLISYLDATYLYSGVAPCFSFIHETYNKEDNTVFVSLIDEEEFNFNGRVSRVETHKAKLVFNYDKEIRKEVKGIVEGLPKSDIEGDTYWYTASDLELINYWLTTKSTDDINATAFLNFSGEFKKAFDYKNYDMYIDPGFGEESPLKTGVGGNGFVLYNGIAYGNTNIGVKSNHILYVPTDTADTPEAKKAAVQKKLQEFLEDPTVTVKEDTVKNAVYYVNWLQRQKSILKEYPNATLEQFINEELFGWELAWGDLDGFLQMIGMEEYSPDDKLFYVTINGINRYFEVECNSEKIVEAVKYQSSDVKTNISIRTDAKIPLDTRVQAEKLESGEEYDRVMGVLGVGENATYSIKLYSETAKQYITKLEDGKFEVRLPIPEKLKGKELIVYYVDSKGNVSEHKVTVDGNFAVFTTDHFSTYVLSEPRVISQAPSDTPADTNDNNKGTSPKTGCQMPWVLALAFVCMTLGGYSLIKSVKNS